MDFVLRSCSGKNVSADSRSVLYDDDDDDDDDCLTPHATSEIHLTYIRSRSSVNTAGIAYFQFLSPFLYIWPVVGWRSLRSIVLYICYTTILSLYAVYVTVLLQLSS